MVKSGDCDPAYPGLRYVANRFELNIEQRYWLAWLYACCYCVPTVYYIYNEFPDYEFVEIPRLQWWWNTNKHKLIFQTDRLKVKSFNNFVKMFESYKSLVGKSQKDKFESLLLKTKEDSYDNIYNFSSKLFYFGRYSLFLYLEAMNQLTEIPIAPSFLDFKNAVSCRNGMCYVLGLDEWITRKDKIINLKPNQFDYMQGMLKNLKDEIVKEYGKNHNYWNIETSLCAYKKLFWKTRYLGYYIDRLMVEIKKMESNVSDGVDWSVLWDFRKEHFEHRWLGELGGWSGIRNNKMGEY